MPRIIGALLAPVVVVGAVLATYVVLTPDVWSRSVFSGVVVLASISGGGAVAGELRRDAPAPLTTWWSWTALHAVTSASLLVVVSVLLGGPGAGTNLDSAPRALIAGGAAVLLAGSFAVLARGRRIFAVLDPERERRLAAAREQARRNVDDFMDGLSKRAE